MATKATEKEKDNNLVQVDKAQLDELISQNQDLKFENGELHSDIKTIIGAFEGLAVLFKGKTSMIKILPVITDLISHPGKMDKLAHIVPIIDKYTENKKNG